VPRDWRTGPGQRSLAAAAAIFESKTGPEKDRAHQPGFARAGHPVRLDGRWDSSPVCFVALRMAPVYSGLPQVAEVPICTMVLAQAEARTGQWFATRFPICNRGRYGVCLKPRLPGEGHPMIAGNNAGHPDEKLIGT